MDLQSGLGPLPEPHSTADSGPKEESASGLSEELCEPLLSKSPAVIAESLCAANMDFSHLLGFLPLNLPPYSAPMMGYTSAPSSSCSSSSEPHAAPLTSVQPQPQEPPVFSSTTLPRFHQAFQ